MPKAKRTRNSVRKIIQFERLIYDKTEYLIGDSVAIKQKGVIKGYGKITKIWRNRKINDGFIKIRWYYTPDQIFKDVPDFISNRELFESNHSQHLSVQTISGKIEVLSIEKYCQQHKTDKNIHFVRSFYIKESGLLIPSIEEWDKVCLCKKAFNPDKLMVRCDICLKKFHTECTGYNISSGSNWFCKQCINNSLN
ncbi:hypothetical protein SteCoe_16369 [Stentor coeruleus]|uniref:BAH domain-containing protein n=1 Tax=Stentor coeruleus TaxID=5963 RepID=A0A1R2C1I0_9CILI|nr:hypothetical protein SteCoe_16369 [Stentor coeruleus]